MRPLVEEQCFEQFREWLAAARTASVEPAADGDDAHLDDAAAFQQLLEELTALRHDLKLQTKSLRGLAEKSETSAAVLQAAADQFRSVQARDQQAVYQTAKPLADALVILDDSLERAMAELQRAEVRIVEEARRALHQRLDGHVRRIPFWRRWLFRRQLEALHPLIDEHTDALVAPGFGALVDGFAMVRARLHKLMEREVIERIACVGHLVDAEKMTVVEAVSDPEKPPGTVVEEIRRGYLWKGQVLRFAEVRAVRG